MFFAASAAILVAMVLTIIRAVAGPTLYDRVLAGNSFGTKTVLLLGLMGYLTDRPDFLDIALLYALLNFVATIAILKFFRYRTMAPGMDDSRGDAVQENPRLPEGGTASVLDAVASQQSNQEVR